MKTFLGFMVGALGGFMVGFAAFAAITVGSTSLREYIHEHGTDWID